MSTAQALHAKFFPPSRPIVSAPHVLRARAEAVAVEAMAAQQQAYQRGYERGLAEGEKVSAIAAALRGDENRNPTMMEIAQEVAKQHGLKPWRALRKKSRAREFVIPRQEAMWRCHRETDQSLPSIGRFFGGFDHTTVLHAIRSYEKRALIDSAVRGG